MSITISVVRSAKRRRSLTMRIMNRGEIELRTPSQKNAQYLIDFIANNSRFLAKSLHIPTQAILPTALQTGTSVSIFGRQFLLEIVSAKKQHIAIDFQNQAIVLKKRGSTILKTKFYNLLTPTLEQIVLERAPPLANKMSNKPYNAIHFKLTRSRWGSCTNTGNLSFNKRLVHYPLAVIDYVIIHELAHLQEHNHSQAFWDIVKKHCPENTSAKKTLKTCQYG